MIFTPLAIEGVVQLDPERHADERGYFARSFCRREFEAHGLPTEFVQENVSFNLERGTLRGLHYQAAPHAEAKTVRCTRGRVHDVVVDLREGSSTRGQWLAVELTAENGRTLFVPEGCAHGFLTLADASEVFYQMSTFYSPEHARGVRWDDPTLAIGWPLEGPPIVSARDRELPPFEAL